MINVLIHTDTRYPVNRKIIRKAVSDVFAKNKIKNTPAEVSVSVVGVRKMKSLAQNYLGDSLDHEVLAFALEGVDNDSRGGGWVDRGFINPPDGVLRLGDVVLCWPEILRLAVADNVLVDREVYFLTCHGVEHLLGKHHETSQ